MTKDERQKRHEYTHDDSQQKGGIGYREDMVSIFSIVIETYKFIKKRRSIRLKLQSNGCVWSQLVGSVLCVLYLYMICLHFISIHYLCSLYCVSWDPRRCSHLNIFFFVFNEISGSCYNFLLICICISISSCS